MTQPAELKSNFPMQLSGGIMSTTHAVWDILSASYRGDLPMVKQLVEKTPALIFAQYNYTPPIHFAVREGHLELVKWLLVNGAHDPTYRIYPFLDSLLTLAIDRDYREIAALLEKYERAPDQEHYYKGDNGKIFFGFTELEKTFEQAVSKNEYEKVKELLAQDPGLINNQFYFWGEGILTVPLKHGDFDMAKLLIDAGASIPALLKWNANYYFEKLEGAAFILDHGMDPNIRSWQEVTILHDMAQRGLIAKAKLLLDHGVYIDPIDDEYQSTPLGMAASWGHIDMVSLLLERGADPNKSGAAWSTPLAWAKRRNHPAIEKLLIDAGAN